MALSVVLIVHWFHAWCRSMETFFLKKKDGDLFLEERWRTCVRTRGQEEEEPKA